MKSCIFPAALRLLVIAGAIGLAAPPSVSLAQGTQAVKKESSAPASTTGTVSGVIVQAPPKLDHRIPPAKRAAFDAEAAKRKSWTKYRATTPGPLAKGPGASPQTDNYPGLHTLGSH